MTHALLPLRLALAFSVCTVASLAPALATHVAQDSTKPTAASATMKAVRIHEFGGVDKLKYEDAPKPAPGDDDLLVRVHAAGVNPVDAKVRSGAFRAFGTLPMTLGWDVSGVVEQVGKNVTKYKVGDAV